MNVIHLHIFFISRKHDENFEPSDPYMYLCKDPPHIFYFIFSRFLRFFPTRPSAWNTLILRHPVYYFCGGREKVGKSKMLIFQGNDSKFHIIPKIL
jgi:hypothetical protein